MSISVTFNLFASIMIFATLLSGTCQAAGTRGAPRQLQACEQNLSIEIVCHEEGCGLSAEAPPSAMNVGVDVRIQKLNQATTWTLKRVTMATSGLPAFDDLHMEPGQDIQFENPTVLDWSVELKANDSDHFYALATATAESPTGDKCVVSATYEYFV
ncbi:expressed unknown protein [Seminavis robusta]|uniref:Uncharacterized protein n=1 Tax=Seminavis robusta TaxID=568900 RepID=A0A9N8F3S7_9STRA|nr:expressed unknown protein [Seminavis robusta]|eukprot:Sro3088_g343450.1 n/a (157) ;mRNA; r:3369-3839